ncbi:Aflatoxin B1 aldehyde reductase member 2 [Coniochaeta pulveracea]|uniref:Aflatoxin B1 aldehyde reductase member 2 n=1 Tax=Coniochaeta pulveracea TaxID=177199 RepID=A0A420YNU1_9PEZI|nr:Aflatoxin B1 aldehyde reductase member 2 [Coniochaeta pulveracea]
MDIMSPDDYHQTQSKVMSCQPLNTVFGGTRIGNRQRFTPAGCLEKFLDILVAHGVTTIDTAQSYGNSEATIGQVDAGQRFTIDTKWSPPWTEPAAAWATREQIINSANESIRKLGVNQVDVFYLHRPDPLTPIAETLSAVNEVYKLGAFRRFGLSGFPASQVEVIHDHCAKRGYAPPTVYQGSYNPLSRSKETVLFPTLRKLGMSFYAYGPSAGGFLGKTVAQIQEMSRDPTLVSATCRPYVGNPRYLDALAKWHSIAWREGITGAELAYRWVAYHSALSRDNGDAMIIGTSSPEQLEETLTGTEKGPLSVEACTEIHDIWAKLQLEA